MNTLLDQKLKLKSSKNSKAQGFTLVEILVVIVIALVVLSIAIPRIRTVNKERNLRETARIVGSAFANASQRAVSDGAAGVRIVRNPNFILGTRQFAATEVSLLRNVPNYVGDTEGAEIDNAIPAAAPDNQIAIQIPLEQDTLNIVQPGDQISFGTSPTRYLILEANRGLSEDGMPNGSRLQIVVDLADYLPAPPNDSTFVIHRRPRVLTSSLASLPDNYMIDLRYSGFLLLDGYDPDNNPATNNSLGCFDFAGNTIREQQLTTVFEPAPTDFAPFGSTTLPANPVENYTIDILFDGAGAVDQIIYTEDGDEDGDGVFFETVLRRPLGPLYFFVTESPNSLDMNGPIATADDVALWVSVATSGSSNIGYNNASESQATALTENVFGAYYFADDPDGSVDNVVEEDDRDEFNSIIGRSRDNSLSASAAQ